VIGKFGPVPADRVDYALADELVTELCEERLAIERARELGAPLMRRSTRAPAGAIGRAGAGSPTLGVSDTLIGKVRRREPGTSAPKRATATTCRGGSWSRR